MTQHTLVLAVAVALFSLTGSGCITFWLLYRCARQLAHDEELKVAELWRLLRLAWSTNDQLYAQAQQANQQVAELMTLADNAVELARDYRGVLHETHEQYVEAERLLMVAEAALEASGIGCAETNRRGIEKLHELALRQDALYHTPAEV